MLEGEKVMLRAVEREDVERALRTTRYERSGLAAVGQEG